MVGIYYSKDQEKINDMEGFPKAIIKKNVFVVTFSKNQ